MATLIFEKDTHKYTIDGVEVPSVSEVTRFISKELYKDAEQSVLDKAAERGTAIHKATELLDLYGTCEIDDDLVGYIKAYVKYKKETAPKIIKIEWSVNNEQLYAGTLDRLIELDGKYYIIDIKSTKNITRLHKVLYTASQNLYRKAVEKAYPEYPISGIYILQLKSDEEYELIEIDIDDTLADACLTLHEATKKKLKGRKS